MDKLAQRIEACQADKIELKNKTQWITEHVQSQPLSISWWQEPYAIVGGVVVSFSVASIVTLYVASRSK
jgi:hypothetical protein